MGILIIMFSLICCLVRVSLSIVSMTTEGATGDPWVGYDTLAKDLVSAVSTLKHQAKIDENKIGVIGHSQGGAIGPMAALHSSEISFLVILGGPGVPGDKLMTNQKSDALKAAGIQGAYYEKRMAAYRLLMKTIVDNGDEHAVERALTALFDVEIPPPFRKAMPEGQFETLFAQTAIDDITAFTRSDML